MKSLRTLGLAFLCLFVLGSLTATAADLPPPVKATHQGDQLVLSFPAGTIKESVSLKAHGVIFSRRQISQCHKAFLWTSDTDLTIDLCCVHCWHHCSKRQCGRHHCCKRHCGHRCAAGEKIAELWVSGQVKSGEALLQKIVVNP